MPTRNPTWERDEVILALDLYFHYKKPIVSQALRLFSSARFLIPYRFIRTDMMDTEILQGFP